MDNNEILFKISCKKNFKRQMKFRNFIYIKRLMIPHILLVAWAVVICCLKLDILNYILTVILVLWPPLVYLVSTLKEITLEKDVPDEYVVYADRIENSDYKGRTVTYFNECKTAYETADYFYIDIGKYRYYIIDKDKFEAGSSEDFGKFLSEKLGAKFKVHK